MHITLLEQGYDRQLLKDAVRLAALVRAVQSARRACNRGAGPAKHSAALPFQPLEAGVAEQAPVIRVPAAEASRTMAVAAAEAPQGLGLDGLHLKLVGTVDVLGRGYRRATRPALHCRKAP